MVVFGEICRIDVYLEGAAYQGWWGSLTVLRASTGA